MKKRTNFKQLRSEFKRFQKIWNGPELQIQKVRKPWPRGGVRIVTQQDQKDLFRTGLLPMEHLLLRMKFARQLHRQNPPQKTLT